MISSFSRNQYPLVPYSRFSMAPPSDATSAAYKMTLSEAIIEVVEWMYNLSNANVAGTISQVVVGAEIDVKATSQPPRPRTKVSKKELLKFISLLLRARATISLNLF